MKKELKNKVFEQWLIVRDEIRTNPEQSLKDIITRHDLSDHVSKIFVELKLIKSYGSQNGHKNIIPHWKIINDISDKISFDMNYGKVKGLKIYFVFDQNNKLIDSDYNLKKLIKKYGGTYRRILTAIKYGKEINSFYFSNDVNFKIEEKVVKYKSLKKAKNKILKPKKEINLKKNLNKKKDDISKIGTYEEKLFELAQAGKVLAYAKSMNKKERYITKKDAVRASLARLSNNNKL